MRGALAVYEQRSGLFVIFSCDDGGNERVHYEAFGYAGKGPGKNSPEHQAEKGVGPLPTGHYRVQRPTNHPRLGPVAFPLAPFAVNQMHKRSGFYIHGDSRRNPGNASSGCIILNRSARDAIVEFDVQVVEVISGHNRGASQSAESGEFNTSLEVSGTSDTSLGRA